MLPSPCKSSGCLATTTLECPQQLRSDGDVLHPADDADDSLPTENALGDRVKRFGPSVVWPCLGEADAPERRRF